MKLLSNSQMIYRSNLHIFQIFTLIGEHAVYEVSTVSDSSPALSQSKRSEHNCQVVFLSESTLTCKTTDLMPVSFCGLRVATSTYFGECTVSDLMIFFWEGLPGLLRRSAEGKIIFISCTCAFPRMLLYCICL